MALLPYANEVDNDKLMAAENTGTRVIYAKGDSFESCWGVACQSCGFTISTMD